MNKSRYAFSVQEINQQIDEIASEIKEDLSSLYINQVDHGIKSGEIINQGIETIKKSFIIPLVENLNNLYNDNAILENDLVHFKNKVSDLEAELSDIDSL